MPASLCTCSSYGVAALEIHLRCACNREIPSRRQSLGRQRFLYAAQADLVSISRALEQEELVVEPAHGLLTL
jgi:hypothetical protein